MSTSESTSQQTQTTQQTDNRHVVGQGAINAEGGSSVVVQSLDANVANDAFALARATSGDAITGMQNVSELAIGAAGAAYRDSTKQALNSLNATEQLVAGAYADAKGRGKLTDTILIGAIVMTGLVALAAVRK